MPEEAQDLIVTSTEIVLANPASENETAMSLTVLQAVDQTVSIDPASA